MRLTKLCCLCEAPASFPNEQEAGVDSTIEKAYPEVLHLA